MVARQPLERLRAQSKHFNTGLEDLAEAIGRPRSYLQRYVREGVPAQLDDADRDLLCRFFGVPAHELGGAIRAGPSFRW